MTRSLAIARNDLRILRRDPFPLVLIVAMPLVLMPLLVPALRLTLLSEGVRDPSGAQQAVPAMDVLFGFFLASQVTFGIYNEHTWLTWDRLRASPASTREILAGKLVVPFLAAATQFVVLFGVGSIVLHLDVRGPLLQLIAVAAAFSVCLVTLGLAMTALCRSVVQVNVVVNILAMLLAGLGGALVPESLLPRWAAVLAPAVPSYWAMLGYRHAILGLHGGVLTPVVALLAFAALFALVAHRRLRFDEAKAGI